MSDIYIKDSTGTSSSTWKKAVNIFVKTATGTTSAAWKAATSVWVYFVSGWTRVWPLSGVFAVTPPYITTSSGSTTPLYGVDGVRRIGTTVWGKNGTWNPNGWTINSYQYRWRGYANSDINDQLITTQTALATYSGATSLTLSAAYDRTYLSFFIQANSSGGTAYNGYAESGVDYGRLQIIRRSPLNLTTSLSSYAPQVGSQITYSSTWDETDAYAAESYRTSVAWYKNLSNSTSGGTWVGSGNTYTPQSSDLGYYLYVVETRQNSGSDYDLGINTGVEAKVITTSTVASALTAPTSVNINSISRYDNTSINAIINFSGGSGPYYQLYWTTGNPAPVTASYDSASTGSPIADVFSPSSGYTYYFYVRSSTENLGNTNSNGISTAGTYSPYSTAYASYTFYAPSGATASISGTSSVGSTLTYTGTLPTTSSPASDVTSTVWRVNDGGPGGNSFTGGSILQTGGSTFVIPATMYGISTVGYSVRVEVTFNNGVGTQIATSNAIQITAAATKLATPTNVSASDNRSDGIQVSWTNVANAATYGVWWGGAPSYDSTPDFGGPNNNGGKTITGSPFLDDGVTTGTTRDYYVQAFPSVGSTTYLKSNWSSGDSGTRVAASNPPTGGSVSVSPSTGTAGTTTYTASASGWSGTGTITYSYSWQYFSSSSFSYVQYTTGSTFSPPSNINTVYPNYGWRVVVTASNGVSPNGTASASFTINNPASGTAPSTPTGLSNSYSSGPSWTGSWSASTGTSPITYYWTLYQSSSNGGSITATANGSTTGTSFTKAMTSSNGLWAYFTVYASNAYGTSGTATSSWA